MSDKGKLSIARHRARMTRRGFVRVEVSVRAEDARLVRNVAAALANPIQQRDARVLLQKHFVPPPTADLKALLASAPLDGINLERERDFGRDVDL